MDDIYQDVFKQLKKYKIKFEPLTVIELVKYTKANKKLPDGYTSTIPLTRNNTSQVIVDALRWQDVPPFEQMGACKYSESTPYTFSNDAFYGRGSKEVRGDTMYMTRLQKTTCLIQPTFSYSAKPIPYRVWQAEIHEPKEDELV